MATTEPRSAVRIARFGAPVDAAEHVATEDLPGPLGPDEAELTLVASPVNPADLLLLRGEYAFRPPIGSVAGLEGVARVRAVGDDVSHVGPGDLVLLPAGTGAWQSHVVADASRLQALPPGIDPLQLAMLAVNPATAYRLLHHTAPVAAGEWVVQNAANSAVGRWVVRLARLAGIRTISVVRRAEVVDELRTLGAEHVLLAGEDLAREVVTIAGDEPVRLALDAVGGDDAGALLSSLAPGGTLVTYGDLSGEPSTFSSADLIFGGRSITGFNIGDWLASAPPEEVGDLYGTVLGALGGDWAIPVAGTYRLQDVASALDHAGRSGRDGKVLLVGPGL